MDNIFGVGLPEFVLVLVIAGMVMGPERIARAARTLGAMTARLQSVSRSFFRQLNVELDSVDQNGQLRSTLEELNTLKREVTNLRNEVVTLAAGTTGGDKQTPQNLRKEEDNSIMPPDVKAAFAKSRLINPERSSEVHRLPSLAEDNLLPSSPDSMPADSPVNLRPVKLPKRVDVREDPDV